MPPKCNRTSRFVLLLALSSTLLVAGWYQYALAEENTAQAAETPAKSRIVGAIIAIRGNSLTVKTDNDGEITVQVEDDTRMVQTAPGQKDLSGATPIHLSDLEVGDRVLVRAGSADDGKIQAKSLIAMKQTDIAQKQAQDRQDWQHRGVGGLVQSVDPASREVIIKASDSGGAKPLTIHLTPTTVVRRYSTDSVKFDDAKPGTVQDIKPGDQLRARGNKSEDGSELTADEIVSGTFRNVAATVVSVDPAAGTLALTDLASKKPVTIRVTADSQLRRLPQMMAQGIAARLKGVPGGATPGANGSAASAPPSTGSGDHEARSNQPRGTAGTPPGRSGDMQQMLAHAPAIQLPDLKKGDAVMIVATEGSPNTPATAITLLAGVEPMLQASTSASQNMLMASWNLNSTGGQDAQ